MKKFKEKASKIIKKAQKKIDKLNGLVLTNTSSGENMEGFLLGKPKEYSLCIDRENFDLRVDLDMELWNA